MTTLITRAAPDVWVATGQLGPWLRAAADPDDRAVAAALPRRRTAEFLAGRALLRHLLRLTVPERASTPIRADAKGRPVLDGDPDTGISVSHDGPAIAVAVARGRRVGVDVQLPVTDVPDSLLRRCLGRHTEDVMPLCERRRGVELAWVWTAQEACVKAAGTGLAGSPWSINIPPGSRAGRWDGYRWISLRDRSPTPLSCAFSLSDAPSDADGLEATCS
ncbi:MULTISPECIES: 4-phosphopantetheinyl transferase [unclassified Streptomyces]|uniref:4'-phosphopantetheinyl transferase family protein n=1 Tax=unclassified Streptomyces TaxID=2593676 RepID=UPI000DB9B740|nr:MULTISPECIES: 4-phosphopantetheinyl transferase [unclassified Streptomyces]MYT75250.1 4-phosphopantetheinyl transferase [Streptomyces sp. SID8367]RAJ77206.1 4'-phosphopantetheinyl transferase [Streptomyces sp. PsTaAH-137]